jgi:SecD/SecF fusion protein
MVETPWRRFLFVILLGGLGALALWLNGINLGLDLRGGTRLLYRVDIEAEKKAGNLPKDADAKELMIEMLTIISRRIDPQGLKDAAVTQAGREGILIELPGGDERTANAIQARIEDLGALEMHPVVYSDYSGKAVDGRRMPDGKSFDPDKEKERLSKWLEKEENRQRLISDPVKAIKVFNQLSPANGGPLDVKYARWFAMHRDKGKDATKTDPKWVYENHPEAYPDGQDQSKPSFMLLNMFEVEFKGEDLDAKALFETPDPNTGEPGIDYSILPAKAGYYRDVSVAFLKKAHAIVLNGSVRLAPRFNSAIDGRGIISGGFTSPEVSNLIVVLKTGSLKIIPELESKTTVGATLGAEAIEKGRLSISIGGTLILVFMVLYYRITGLVAIGALLLNLALIFGAISFMRATLTLPGLAGIVLTIGMAVDANILIFERIREELDKGKDLLRGVEAGFEKAMSTIIDANATTFLTGLILYNVGVGPIRGFAVTLMLGIASSVFCAIFVGKLLFHALLVGEKLKELKMARLFATPTFRLLSFRKVTMVLSLMLVAGGLAGFFSTDNQDKYGLDFTGGAAFRIALNQPMTPTEVRRTLQQDAQFQEAQVTTAGAITNGKASSYLVKLKLNAAKRDEYTKKQKEAKDKQQTYVPPFIDGVRSLMKGKLAYEPVSHIKSAPFEAKNFSIVEGRLHSSTKLKVAEVKAMLEQAWPTVTEVKGLDASGKTSDIAEATDIHIVLRMDAYKDDADVKRKFEARVPLAWQEALAKMKDASGKAILLSSPFPESSLIGSRAVGDLRDRAIGAMLLSLLIIVLYIRIRFHEYKYGVAAVVALLHDVIITLGVITMLNAAGIIHAEIDLAMIAAFLTIIGYSLNDTIVVFDRIRENVELQNKLGGNKSFEELVDGSVNQTLSRTVLTSITTFVVVATLFAFNYGAGSALEGFAFSMMIGVIIGTYSSIWVANPVVLWLTNREAQHSPPQERTKATKSAKAQPVQAV